MKIRVRQEAINDLAAIHAWIATDRPIVAEKIIDQIMHNVETIALFPRLGRSGDARNTLEWVTPGLPYIITYQLDTKSKLLTVLAVFHSSQNRSA